MWFESRPLLPEAKRMEHACAVRASRNKVHAPRVRPACEVNVRPQVNPVLTCFATLLAWTRRPTWMRPRWPASVRSRFACSLMPPACSGRLHCMRSEGSAPLFANTVQVPRLTKNARRSHSAGGMPPRATRLACSLPPGACVPRRLARTAHAPAFTMHALGLLDPEPCDLVGRLRFFFIASSRGSR